MSATAEGDLAGRYASTEFTALELAALDWLDGFYQLEHLLSAREWAIRLDPCASDALRFAALVHDAERFFPGGPSSTPQDGFDNPDYLFAHSLRSADIVQEWLAARGLPADDPFSRRVRVLILRHELGGDTEEDILQAADSLAFLSTFDWLVVQWVRDGHYTVPRAREKLDWTMTRIRLTKAMGFALPLYADIVSALENPTPPAINPQDRRTLAGNRDFLLGLTSTTCGAAEA